MTGHNNIQNYVVGIAAGMFYDNYQRKGKHIALTKHFSNYKVSYFKFFIPKVVGYLKLFIMRYNIVFTVNGNIVITDIRSIEELFLFPSFIIIQKLLIVNELHLFAPK